MPKLGEPCLFRNMYENFQHLRHYIFRTCKTSMQLIYYIMPDRFFSDLFVCEGCSQVTCSDCESEIPKPPHRETRQGLTIEEWHRVCIECGLDWQPLTPLDSEDDDDDTR